jgi:hypothetical protein
MSSLALPAVILLSSMHIPRVCALGLTTATAFLGISLTVTGLCFLALWSLDVVRPPPRQGAILLLLSLLGAASVAVGLGPRPATWELHLAFVTVAVLGVVVPIVLLGTHTK